MIELEPAQIAEFDQAYSASVDALTRLVGSYHEVRREHAALGVPEQVSIMYLAESVAEQWDIEPLVSTLAVAVVLLDRHAETVLIDD